MSEGALFASQFSPTHSRHRYRLWAADLVDLGTAALLGWGGARALDLEQALVHVLAAMACAWVLLSLVGGVRGWTLGRRLLDVRLVTPAGHAPGLRRALARAFTTFPDLFMAPLLSVRPLDRLLGLHGERTQRGRKGWLIGVGTQLPWVAALAAAGWFIATPTRAEAFLFLDRKLTGWKCCHGYRKHKDTWMCRRSVSQLVREARRQDAEALSLVPECPAAAERLRR
jgi:hypothetical protein